jgi:hypothetical protein
MNAGELISKNTCKGLIMVGMLALASEGSATGQATCASFTQYWNTSPYDAGVGPEGVYYVGSGGAGEHLYLNSANWNGVARSEPEPLRGTIYGRAALVRGSDNALWLVQDPGNWTSLGGTITWNPSSASPSYTHFFVFYRGSNQQLYYREYNSGSWSGHISLQGVLTSSPVAIATSTSHAIVMTRGQAHDLWYRQWNGSTWAAWANVPGLTSDSPDPTLISRGAGQVDLAVAYQGSVLLKSFNGTSWGPTVNLGSPPYGANSEPALGLLSANAFRVYVRGGDIGGLNLNAIYYKQTNDGGVTWSDWTGLSIGPQNSWVQSSTSTGAPEVWGHVVAAVNNVNPSQHVAHLDVCDVP